MIGFLTALVAFALVVGPLIFLHELGHYSAGRLFGVKAEEFSIGFGRELFGFFDRRGTRWKVAALPLGGYVRFAGDLDASSRTDPEWQALPEAERNVTFPAKPLWQRAIIIAAGPVTNLLIAFIILAGFAMAYGKPDMSARIGHVEPGSPAASAGLVADDRILSIDGRPMADFGAVFDYVRAHPGATVTIHVDHAGSKVDHSATLTTIKVQVEAGKAISLGQLGIRPGTIRVGPVEAVALSVTGIGQIMGSMGDLLGQILIGHRSIHELGGPLRIAQVSGQQLEAGPASLIGLIALVSINLGFINLLPVPMLDGGHLFFYAIEAVRRRPVSPVVQEWAFRGGLAAVLALMLVVTINDLGALGLWKSLTGLSG
ncbi:M50 family metallopeptidase [Sphingomonas sp. GlSt437]|uniref:M50 family metallopeptidase n=1 Tax=Sphingomonas sp. GlSt437 TaxID=3389970 RepID=UPI003A84C574